MRGIGDGNIDDTIILSRKLKRSCMKKSTAKDLKEEFIKYVNNGEFSETDFEWHEYDSQTKQIFIWVEGEWNPKIRKKLKDYMRQYNRKILISRMIRD
jgi:hypothetical protein